MKFIPIIYNTEMVHALRAGTKGMTRRMKGLEKFNINPDAFKYNGGLKGICRFCKEGTPDPNPLEVFHLLQSKDGFMNEVKCPYGKVGDVLWVRESFLFCIDDEFLEGMDSRTIYKASVHSDWFDSLKEKHSYYRWTPSIHMPKEACRMWLEVTDVRLERLQNISNEDAINEGIKVIEIDEAYYDYMYPDAGTYAEAKGSFYSLWVKINGEASFILNPWVWVISFKQIPKPFNFFTT